jgi:adenylate cyclase
LERRLAAILAADVAGYSALMGADEAGTLRRLTDLRREFLEPLIDKHHGRVVKLMGDGLLVEFASVVDAVACALAWQSGVAEREAASEEDKRFQFRIGINLGDVIVEGDDIHGDGVNIAARLEGLAELGGICLSGDAYRQVRGKIDAEYENVGERRLKNVAEQVRVYRVVTKASGALSANPAGGALSLPDKPSIAVLPFVNMSGDSDQDYFSDGITEDIITELSRFGSLFVIARNSSFTYKGRAVEVRDVGRELGVRYIVEGSVRRDSGRVRVTVQLVEAETGNHLWAERYDRDLEDIFALQEDVSRTVAATLAGRVEQDRLKLIETRHPESLAAYDYVLRGRAHLDKYTAEDIQAGMRYLEQAAEISPSYVEAVAWLAQCHSWEFEGWWSDDPPSSLETAFQLARRAVEMDSSNAQAHGSLAYALLYKREHAKALHHFDRAHALVPCGAEITANYGMCFMFNGEPDRGLELVQEGERLNPLRDWWYAWLRGMAHYTARRYEAAIEALGQVLYPPVEVHGWLAASHAQLGDNERAREAIARFEAQARQEFPRNPGGQPDGWKNFWWWLEPYRSDDDLEHLLAGLREAGLAV